MLKAARLYSITIALSLALTARQSAGTVASQKEREYTAFGNPERMLATTRGTDSGAYLKIAKFSERNINTDQEDRREQ
jgi:hypothetical protein